MQTNFDRYLEKLSQDGKVLDTGRNFVVHLAKSREKMAAFQGQDPSYCFLKWYQAAVVGGAKEIFFEMDSDHYVMIIPFPEKSELSELCRAFDGEEVNLSRRDRLFLDGLLAATSAELETSISTDDESHVMSAQGLKKPKWWSRLAAYRRVYKKHSVTLSLQVKHSPTFRRELIERIQQRTRFGPIVGYFVLDPSRSPTVIEEDTALFPETPSNEGWFSEYSRIPNLLEAWRGDGPLCRDRVTILKRTRSSANRNLTTLLAQSREQGEIVILFSLHLDLQSHIIPVQHGVTLQPLQLDLGYRGLTVIFHADGLKTDLSGFKLVEGEELDEKIRELRSTVDAVVKENLERIEQLQARKKYGFHPKGILFGTSLGCLVAIKTGGLAQLSAAVLFAFLGWTTERFLCRRDLERQRNERSKTFRNEILKRLQPETPRSTSS